MVAVATKPVIVVECPAVLSKTERTALEARINEAYPEHTVLVLDAGAKLHPLSMVRLHNE